MKKRFVILALLATVSTVAEAHHRRGTILLNPDPGATPIVITAPLGTNPTTDVIVTLKNNGGPGMSYTTASNHPWLLVSPTGPSLTLKPNESVDLHININVQLPPPNDLGVGDHPGAITITRDGGAETRTINIIARISSTAQIGLTPTPPGPLTFAAPAGGTTPAAQSITVQNTGGGTLEWQTSSNQPWLHIAPAPKTLSSLESVGVAVSVDMQPAGTYSGTVTVTGINSSVSAGSKTINVTFTVSSLPVFGLSPTSLTFDAAFQGSDPPPQFAALTNNGGAPINSWTTTVTPASNWLTLSPSSGSLGPGQPVTLTVSVDVTPGGVPLASATYITDIQFFGDNGTTNSPKLRITLNVNAEPKIGLSSKNFSFSVSVDDGSSPATGLSVTNTGFGTLDWELAGGAPWLAVSAAGGSLTALQSQAVLLTANVAGLSPGVYTATIQIQNRTSPPPATPATNSPQSVNIDLTVTPPNKPTSAPVGQCGLLGLEALLPALGILAWRRSARRKDAA